MTDIDGKIECDGINHHVKIDFITFVQYPDNVWRRYATGNAEQVKQTVADYKASKESNVDIYVEYCCQACKEEDNG
jgi:uncharacterized alkaline shock family protein YloU